MRRQIAIGALLFVDGIERIQPCRRSALSGLAVRPGQGAGNLARRGVGRSAARRHQGQMEGRCQGERAGAETRRQADSARGRPEGDRGISRRLGRRQGHGRQTAVRRPVRYPQCAAFVGPERARTNYPQAARGRRKDPGRCALRCRRCSAASPPDQTKIEELGNQLVWQTRIFEDRQRVVKFVCEVPTAIDQRLFALGRVIQQEME